MGPFPLAAGAAAGVLAWSLFESQWVELVELEVPIAGLPAELEGFRILHLSDFHLGTLSLAGRALTKALAQAEARSPDLVAVTGDLLSRRRGERKLRAALARLHARYGVHAILGNHDVDETRDPFSEPTEPRGLEETGVSLLSDSTRSFEVGATRVQVVGLAPALEARAATRPATLVDPDAGFRILLSHFPDVVDELPAGAFDLVLAGHLHGGQICVPTPLGKLRLSHVRGSYWEGLFRLPAATLYVSRGLGTTFVPVRLLCRPEAAELTLTALD